MKNYLIFLISCFLFFDISAQELPKNSNAYDLFGKKTGAWTILFNSEWNITEVIDSVEFYRLINYDNGLPIGKVTDYYLNGVKQWEGKLISVDPHEIKDDTCIWYNINSTVKINEVYLNGNLNGISTYNDSIGNTFLKIDYLNNDFAELVFSQLDKNQFPNILEVINSSQLKNSISICNAILDDNKLFFSSNPIFKSILLNTISEKYYFLGNYVSAKKYQLLSFNILSENMKIESGLYIDNLFGDHYIKSPYVDSSFVYRSNYLRNELDTIQDVNNFLVLYNNIASNYMHSERYLNEYFGYDNNLELKKILKNNSIFILRDFDSIILDGKKNNKLIEISHLQRVSMYYGLFGDPSSINFAINAYDLVKSEYNPSDFSYIISEFYLGKAYLYNYYYDDAAIYFNSVAEKLIDNIDIYTRTLPNILINKLYDIALEVFNNLIASDAWNAYTYELYSLIDSREISKIKYKNRYLRNSNDTIFQTLTDSINNIYKEISKCYELSIDQQKKYNLNLDSLIESSIELEIKINKYLELPKLNYDVSDITSKLNKDEVYIDIINITIDYNDSIPQWLPHYFVYVFKSDSIDSSNYYFDYYRDSDSLELNPVRGLDAMFFPINFDFHLDSIYSYYSNYIRPSGKEFSYSDKVYGNICYQNFWSKLESESLLEGISTVYFSPEGLYSKINPNVLYDSISNSFLIDKYEIVYVSNIEDFIHQKENIQLYDHSDDLYAVLIGNPTFLLEEDALVLVSPENQSRKINQDELNNLQRGMLLSNLPATQTEIDLISDNLKSKGWNVDLIDGVDATETSVKNVKSPKILHIATHGFFFEDENMLSRSKMISTDNKKAVSNSMTRSGLIFSGAENTMNGEILEHDNGWLNSYEASFLNLRGTELVVLSACKTGTGDVQNGKGVYGLQRAIRVAGAESLIMSMWDVDDKATQELMTSFYDFWIDQKMTKRDAFKKAQQKIREKYKHPYYWGAFIMIGK